MLTLLNQIKKEGYSLDAGTVEVVTQVINNVGFPIVVAIALFYQNSVTNKKYAELLQNLTTIINNNTDSIESLTRELRG